MNALSKEELKGITTAELKSDFNDDTLTELIDFRRTTYNYHIEKKNKVQATLHGLVLVALEELQGYRKTKALLERVEPECYGPYTPTMIGAGVWVSITDELPPHLEGREVWVTTALPAPVVPDPAYNIEEFGVFKVTTGDKGLDIEISDFHFSSGTAPEDVTNKPMIVKYAIQAIINRLQNYCEELEDSPLEEVFSIKGKPLVDNE